MGKLRIVVAFFCLLQGPGIILAAPPTAELEEKEEKAFQQAAALVSPSVVRIETVGGLDRVSGQLVATGPTTGLIVAADGWILSSAFNFVSKPTQILVTLPDGRRVAANLIATDRVKMLALLKVAEQNLPVPQAAPLETMKAGQWAIALGRTLDKELPSISVGIISALQRVWGKAIQTDAKVSPLNYGGPLVDIEGRVLGILVPLSPQGKDDLAAGVEWYDSGIGFAIPLAAALQTLEKLKQGQDLLPGLLGVTFKSRDEFGGEPVLDRVRYNSPAQVAGFKSGDVIIQADDQNITRIAQFRHVLGTKYAGDAVKLTARRGTMELSADAKLIGVLEPYENPYLGILLDRSAGSAELQPGVGIRFVFEDSPASKAALKAGDRIIEVNDQKVVSGNSLRDTISRLRPLETLKLRIDSVGQTSREIKLNLGRIPQAVPSEVSPSFIPPPAKDQPVPAELKTGLLTETSEVHAQDYWAYVPADYNPDYQYGLLVWLHPPVQTQEAAVLKVWKKHCEERGIILLAPKAKLPIGWTSNELEFIKDMTLGFIKKYSIDPQRIVVHGMGASGGVAFATAFQERELFRGILAIRSIPKTPPIDNEPDASLQFYLFGPTKAPFGNSLKGSVEALRNLKFPVILKQVESENEQYPDESDVAEFARWLDLLDRI